MATINALMDNGFILSILSLQLTILSILDAALIQNSYPKKCEDSPLLSCTLTPTMVYLSDY